jgi:hypothetical protein
VRGFFLLSMLASLLLLPAAVYLYQSLRHQAPGMVAVYTLAGVADLFTRATSHAVVAIQGPRLIRAYQSAAASDREFIQDTFTNGMTELAIKLDLADLLGGVWLLGIGWMLRWTHRSFALLTLVMGSLELLVGAGSLFSLWSGSGPHFIARMLLAPVWAIALGIVVARRPLHAGASARGAVLRSSFLVLPIPVLRSPNANDERRTKNGERATGSKSCPSGR